MRFYDRTSATHEIKLDGLLSSYDSADHGLKHFLALRMCQVSISLSLKILYPNSVFSNRFGFDAFVLFLS